MVVNITFGSRDCERTIFGNAIPATALLFAEFVIFADHVERKAVFRMTRISDLSTELLLLIASFLSQVDLLNVSLTDKHLRTSTQP